MPLHLLHRAGLNARGERLCPFLLRRDRHKWVEGASLHQRSALLTGSMAVTIR